MQFNFKHELDASYYDASSSCLKLNCIYTSYTCSYARHASVLCVSCIFV